MLFHLAAIWALHSGLMRRTMEVVVPAAILSEMVSPPAPKAEPRPVAPEPRLPEIRRQLPAEPMQKVQPPAFRPATLPFAVPQQSPAPNAPTAVLAAQPAPPALAAPVAAETAQPAPAPPAARFEAPTVDADYAPNEDVFRPPAISVRLGEYGTVLLRVTVGVNGQATEVEVVKSSGYPRLDNAAVQGARRLKFRSATRGGAAVEASYQLPVKYSEPK